MNSVQNKAYINRLDQSQSIKKSSGTAIHSLIIEDDYVNYLFLIEGLKGVGVDFSRTFSLKEALLQRDVFLDIDLIIINISLTWKAQKSAVEYLKKVYSVPVLVVGRGEFSHFRYQEIVEWADGIISINTDAEQIIETISDMLNVQTLKPVSI
jgi:hypothetical protein